jgi:hypothetical protein
MTKSDPKTYIGEDNTKPEFFAQWSLRDLQVECARLNEVLKEISRVLDKLDDEIVISSKVRALDTPELAKLDDELAPPNTKH